MISELPLWAFTILTGIACGAYVASALFPAINTEETTTDGPSSSVAEKNNQWMFPLIALVLVAIGGLCAMAHLGRPQLMLNVLNNPTASITMEGICAGVLGVVALIDLILSKKNDASPRWVRIIGAVVAIVFMVVVTSAYVASYGNPAWIAAPTFPLFILGDMAVGLALWLALFNKESKPLMLTSGVFSALFAIDLIWEGAVFAGFGESGTAVIFVGAVIAAVQAVLSFAAWLGKAKAKAPWLQQAILVCAICALVVSRYGFYMASII